MGTPLEATARRRGAAFGEWFGCTLPARFGDAGREWRAAREGCAVFDAGFRSLLQATGEDRVSFLQGMLSNDVKALSAGAGMHAAFLYQTGKIVTDLRLYGEAERIVLDVVSWRVAPFREALERYIIADDVELGVDASDVALLGLEGPFARPILGEALGHSDLPDVPLAHQTLEFYGRRLRVVCASETGGDGYLLCGAAETGASLLDACVEAGAIPMGMEALDVLRIEAGVPWPGTEMDDSVLAMEMPLDDAISFRKGCYLGQEVVERIAARGHVNRRLAGLLLEGERLPAPRSTLRSGGTEVGYVTSAVHSHLLDRPVALALIHRKHLEPGTRLDIDDREGEIVAEVTALPFASRSSDEEE